VAGRGGDGSGSGDNLQAPVYRRNLQLVVAAFFLEALHLGKDPRVGGLESSLEGRGRPPVELGRDTGVVGGATANAERAVDVPARGAGAGVREER